MWTLVKPRSGSHSWATPTRTTPAVCRTRSGHRAACLVLPENMITASRASIYSDGNGKMAFAMKEDGQYALFKSGPGGKAKKVTIPASMADVIPYGTTEAVLTRDGDMLVLDTAQFR